MYKNIYADSNFGIITSILRGGSRAAATSKMGHFVIIVNGCKPLAIITKHSILDVVAALDPLLKIHSDLVKSAANYKKYFMCL